jgi:putative spermidine/putrescine transport system permease protein
VSRSSPLQKTAHRDRAIDWALIGPAAAFMAAFYFVPLGRVLWTSVTEPKFGLSNYALLLDNPAVHTVVATTLRISAITTIVSVTVGYAISYSLVFANSRRRRLMMMFVLLPFWVSVLVRAFAWMILLGREGLINRTLLALGLISEPLTMMYNDFGVLVGMIHYMVPVATLTLYANMSGLDQRLTRAARGLGAPPLQAFLRIFLPLSLPGVAASATLVFVLSMGFYVTPALLGGGKTTMAAQYITVLINETLQWGVATMIATTLLLAVCAALGVLATVFDSRRLFGGR